MNMRKLSVILTALAVAFGFVGPAMAQPVFFYPTLDPVAGFSGGVTASTPCVLTKYVGSTVGKPTVEVAAGGDVTFKIAAVADATTGSPTLNGVFDLSTPAAAVDTMGEFVQLVNSTGGNWRAVLVSCLAADLTDNTVDTLTATDASTPSGVALFRDSTVASASAIFSAQVALVPTDASTNIRFWLSGAPVGNTTGSSKVNENPFDGLQTFIQHIREKITSSGTVALFEVLGVQRKYAGGTSGGAVISETVRTLYAETGAATTVEKTLNFHNGPIVTAPGELVIVRQRTGTALTVESINGSGYTTKYGARR